MQCVLRLFLFLAFACSVLYTQAQDIPTDTLSAKKENTFSSLIGSPGNVGEDVARTIRHTGRRIRKVVNNVDTNYISPNRYNLAFMLEHSTV